jgi:hypothetical protein
MPIPPFIAVAVCGSFVQVSTGTQFYNGVWAVNRSTVAPAVIEYSRDGAQGSGPSCEELEKFKVVELSTASASLAPDFLYRGPKKPKRCGYADLVKLSGDAEYVKSMSGGPKGSGWACLDIDGDGVPDYGLLSYTAGSGDARVEVYVCPNASCVKVLHCGGCTGPGGAEQEGGD